MPVRGVSTRKMKEVLRLYFSLNLSIHQVAKSLSLSSGVVHKYITRAKDHGLGWPLAKPYDDDEELEQLLKQTKSPKQQEVNWVDVHQELKRKGVTLQLVYDESLSANLTQLSYSHFCRRYRQWKATQPRSMRQNHKAGDKVFVDYSGLTVDIIDPETGEIRKAEIFIGVLGASNYTYAEATWTQQLSDWINSHKRMFEYFGGVTNCIVPDNLKSAVTKTCRYEPDINPAYAEFVTHYNTSVLPARPYKPKDKAKAESGVLLVQRWILARIRHQTFVGLDELNQAIRHWLLDLNKKAFKKRPGSRLSQFQELDRPALKPLPTIVYDYKSYKKAKVHIDYHIELEGHYYSVPHQYVGKSVEIRFNNQVVQCYYRSNMIAMHKRSIYKGRHTTCCDHMPKNHKKYHHFNDERFLNWAYGIGKYTRSMVNAILSTKKHKEQGYRSVLGLLKLESKYGKKRLESACRFALERSLTTRKSVVSILEKKLDQQSYEPITSNNNLHHMNIRGANYYH